VGLLAARRAMSTNKRDDELYKPRALDNKSTPLFPQTEHPNQPFDGLILFHKGQQEQDNQRKGASTNKFQQQQ
jgi:hypothetical protein